MSPPVKAMAYVRKDTGNRLAFRQSCFELLWLYLKAQPEGRQKVSNERLREIPADAMITRTDHEDGSATFEISGGELPVPIP